MRSIILAVIIVGFSQIPALADPDDADDAAKQQVTVQPGIDPQQIAAVISDPALKDVKAPTVLAFGDSELKAMAEKAKQAHASLAAVKGDPNVSYDLVIQAGHWKRTKGRTGGQGKYVNEQQMAALLATGLAQYLSATDVKYIIVAADGYERNLKTKIFLSLHTDSGVTPCRLGPSIGYDAPGDAKGMHGIAIALAITLGIDPASFMKANYTSGLSGYYAYKQFNASHFKGVLEMSELTCPKQEEDLLMRAASLSKNLAVAVRVALGHMGKKH